MTDGPDLARRFFELFMGFDRAHGEYLLPKTDPVTGQKVEGSGVTRHTGPSVALWERHLAGTYSLGIVPIRANATSGWGAIDVDDYSIDLVGLDRTIEAAGLPLTVVRTKSGGAHLFLFVAPPASARLIRIKLKEFIKALGLPPSTEVFPKQDSIDSEGGTGNWLNLPYHGGARSLRYALGEGGRALSPEEFLDVAETRTVRGVDLPLIVADPIAVAAAAPAPVIPPPAVRTGNGAAPTNIVADAHPVLPGAPPCLQTLHTTRDVPPGGRNELLYNFAIYFGRVDRATAEEKTAAVNERLFALPLQAREVRQIVRAALKKSYNYRCANAPISGVCDRLTCLTREFGIAARGVAGHQRAGGGRLEFGPMIKYLTTPPLWIWQINDVRIELQTEELLNQRLFIKRVMEESNELPMPIPPTSWMALLTEHLANAQVVIPPPDATRKGQLMYHLGRFLTGRAQARNLDELRLGKPFLENGRHYFVVADFLGYLAQQRVVAITERLVYAWLAEKGFESHVAQLKGASTEYWSVEAFDTQTEPYDVPRGTEEGASF